MLVGSGFRIQDSDLHISPAGILLEHPILQHSGPRRRMWPNPPLLEQNLAL